MNKSTFLVFTFILLCLFSLKTQASEPRLLQGGSNSGSNSGSGGGNSGSNSGSGSGSGSSTGYGTTPVYEEYYEQPPPEEEEEEQYEQRPPYEEKEEEYEEEEKPSYGGGGYGSTPVYEEYYEKPPVYEEEEEYVPPPVYEEEEEEYEEEREEEKYEEEEEYVPPPVYGGGYGGGGYGSTPIYEEYYNEQPEYEVSVPEAYYEETGIYYPEEETYAPGVKPPKAPVYPPDYKTGYVVDIHFLSGDPNFQYIAYHYCQELYPGYSQCDIYNGTKENSKFMASEFVVSREIFETLPMQERKYWHSHEFAVKNGLLVLPTLSPEQELEAMKSVVNTYGKVTDFWHSYQSFPYGGAKLAYGLGDESQIIPEVARQMDEELGLKTTWQERARARRNIVAEPKVEGADEYLVTGEYPQYVTRMFEVQTIGAEEVAQEQGVGGGESVPQEEEEAEVVVEEAAPEEEEEQTEVIIEEFVFEESRRM